MKSFVKVYTYIHMQTYNFNLFGSLTTPLGILGNIPIFMYVHRNRTAYDHVALILQKSMH